MHQYDKNNPQSIQKMFGNIAKNYDRTNAVLSFQMHKLWNKQLIKKVIGTNPTGTLLDLCCGTGEISFTHLKKLSGPCHIMMLDFCEEMLLCAKDKAAKKQIPSHQQLSYIQGDAQEIPLANQTVDHVTVAYGIRNIKEAKRCFAEVHRVLKSGGVFGILELTEPNNAVLRVAHRFYLKYCLPIMGKLLTTDQAAYQYLCNSIHSFIKPHEMKALLLSVGFQEVKIYPQTGGISTILIAKK